MLVFKGMYIYGIALNRFEIEVVNGSSEEKTKNLNFRE